MHTDNAQYRYGSADFASYADFRRAGMLRQHPNSLFIGFDGKRPIWYSGAGGWLIVGGARSGKLRDILGYNICCGICTATTVLLDMKGELSKISQNQTADHKFIIHWNPLFLHDLQSDQFNPVEYIKTDSPTLIADVKVFCQNFLPVSKSANGEYFDRRAQEFLEAIILTLVKTKGQLTLSDLYHVINLIPGNTDEWLDFAYDMQQSGFPISKRIEEEIANSREDTTGGFTGILGVIFKGFACLSDDKLLASVSPPFNVSLKDVVEGKRRYNLNLISPAEFVDGWAPVIKSVIVAIMIYKSRMPHAPQITIIMDECGQLGSFDGALKLFTYGAGIGVRPVAVFQSTKQINNLGKDAENILTSSAQTRSYFGVRDLETARTLSSMIGAETLDYYDPAQQAQAMHQRQQAVLSLMNGNDPVQSMMQYAHHKREANTPRQMQRQKRNPDELLNMPSNKQIVFTDELSKPAYLDRRPYFEERFMAGRFHPNPYHPPADKVRVKTFWGHQWRNVVREPVPDEFTEYPQYANGFWSRVAD